MTSIVADRGQVTIPQELRKRLGIGPRTVLDFRAENGMLIAVKIAAKDPINSALGCLKLNRKVDAIITELRGDK